MLENALKELKEASKYHNKGGNAAFFFHNRQDALDFFCAYQKINKHEFATWYFRTNRFEVAEKLQNAIEHIEKSFCMHCQEYQCECGE